MKWAVLGVRFFVGLVFALFSAVFFLKVPMGEPPADENALKFIGSLAATDYLTVVKVLEFLGGILLLSGPAIVALMTTAPDVRAAAASVLPWLIAAPLVGFASWIWDGVFIGALLTGAMLRAMLPSVALYALALALLVPTFGMHGLWAALTLMNLARGFTLWQRRGQVLALAA